MKKILQIIQSTDIATGGPIEGIKRQAEALERRGIVQEIACLVHDNAGDLTIKVNDLGQDGPLSGILGRYGYSPQALPWLVDNIGNYDAVVINGLWTYSSLVARLALRRRPVPYVVFTHGALGPWFRRTFPIKHAVKQILWWLTDGRLVRDADYVMFTTEDERDISRGVFLGYSYRGRVVGYGTADVPDDAHGQIAAFHQACPRLAGRRLLLFLGRIHPMKGCDLLIRGFATIAGAQPGLDLVFVGPDQIGWQRELTALADALGIGARVHWTGMLTGDRKWGAFRAAEAFALPSHQENFGIVVAEALACGTPVLISDKVNIWHEIADAGCGLVATDSEAGTRDLLHRWTNLPDDERARMAAAARGCFLRHFEAEAFADSFSRVLDDIAASSGTASPTPRRSGSDGRSRE